MIWCVWQPCHAPKTVSHGSLPSSMVLAFFLPISSNVPWAFMGVCVGGAIYQLPVPLLSEFSPFLTFLFACTSSFCTFNTSLLPLMWNKMSFKGFITRDYNYYNYYCAKNLRHDGWVRDECQWVNTVSHNRTLFLSHRFISVSALTHHTCSSPSPRLSTPHPTACNLLLHLWVKRGAVT